MSRPSKWPKKKNHFLFLLSRRTQVGAVWRDAAAKDACVALMREVIRAANADLAFHGAAPRLDEAATVAALSEITDAMAAKDYVPSTTKDFLAGRRMEVEALFIEPLRRATALGVDAPGLATLAALLSLLNDRAAPPAALAVGDRV